MGWKMVRLNIFVVRTNLDVWSGCRLSESKMK